MEHFNASHVGSRDTKEARRRSLKRIVVMLVEVAVIVGVVAIPLYQLVMSLAAENPEPAKITTELLDALESQVVEPTR